MDTLAARLNAVERTEWFRDPVGRICSRQQQLDEIHGRLRLATSRCLAGRLASVHELEVRLVRVRPEVVLARRREALARGEHRLRWAQGHLNLVWERRLRQAASQLLAASPRHHVERERVRIEQLAERLGRGTSAVLLQRMRALEGFEARLKAASHEQVLSRGFSITRVKRGGRIVTEPSQVRDGLRITTQTACGEFDSRVVDSQQGELFET
jgi:exodeoxyribonuclease VII large subunit